MARNEIGRPGATWRDFLVSASRTVNPRGNIANLKPFPPGVSGNPSGRPKRKNLTRALELVARTRVKDGPAAGKRWWTAMALGLAEAAAKGDAAAFKEYANRVEGITQDDPEKSGPPQITINVISVAPQQKVLRATDVELVANTEAIGKTN
jgi:hypothetical protein